VNDSAGSLCELDDPAVLTVLAENSLIVYIEATADNGRELLQRAESDPKPLYYRPAFLDTQLKEFMQARQITSPTQIVPDEFVLWMFPRLFAARVPRYEAIARAYGYTVRADEIAAIQSEADFLTCVERALGST
jgi:hypothetical protein